jgi:2,3-bisphosphoglycerate-independent phosphoglycerate mutase
MKHIILLGDGMADEAIDALGGRTPLQVARTPYMDELARRGRSGILHTIPAGMAPGSEVANLSVLGYRPEKVLEGRGSLEAASMGIPVYPGELVLRCNLICIDNGRIKNHSADHISTEEATVLIDYLNRHLTDEEIRFFSGVSYRHLLKVKGGDKRIRCTPPHDVPGTEYEQVLIRAEAGDGSVTDPAPEVQQTVRRLNDLIRRSQEVLAGHPVNRRRVELGKAPANSIWPWSPGYKPEMKRMSELYPIRSGAVISAVDLMKGIGVYAGLEVVEVPGATGLYDTNYEGKAQAALRALREMDFVYLHVEAPDEAGHEGDFRRKIQTIEDLDQRVLRLLMEETDGWEEAVTMALLPDHPTPCRIRTHTAAPVPFVICRPGAIPDDVDRFDEVAAQRGGLGERRGDGFIREVFHIHP